MVLGRRNPRRGRPEHLWEAVDRQLRTGDLDQIPRLAIITVQHIYAAHAAAIQTGIGNPATKGIVRLARTSEPLAEQSELDQEPQPEDPASVASTWLDVAEELLVAAGWHWDLSARQAAEAAAGCGADGRGLAAGSYRRSPMARHPTGVPAGTWSSLELLILGSGPGCNPDHYWPGLMQLLHQWPPEQIRGDPEVQRIIGAAVAGVAARTNRRPRT